MREHGQGGESRGVDMKEWPEENPPKGGGIRFEFSLITGLLTFAALFAAYAFLSSTSASAHPGGLAADGCHNDRKNGGRHCHRGPNAGPTTQPKPSGGREVYYPNCAAARAAGAAPVLIGEPGYGRHLDRDGDGIGCE